MGRHAKESLETNRRDINASSQAFLTRRRRAKNRMRELSTRTKDTRV